MDVLGETTLTLPVSAQGYRVAVQGPNRFWYELAGARVGSAAQVAVGLSPASPLSARLAQLSVGNAGNEPVNLVVTALAYSSRVARLALAPNEQRTVAWPTDQGWYDLEVRSEEDRAFRRRLTGRIEDGRPGLTG